MTVKLSIVIVNYNVRYFLEQCLRSVISASKNLEMEIIVVDNNSTDGSREMMQQLFPDVTYHFLDENLGFSKGNNYGITRSSGEYVLLLNPDTVVAEDALDLAVGFMDSHIDAGGLGVRMIDGTGHFLPESKRGLPTPSVAFYKVFGLASLFPSSRRLAKYHLSYLDDRMTHEVEILSGAFMMMRRSALDKAGLLDETFFMYGEDIDLSYRLIKAGYKNYYFPKSRIIHYKGESTKKGSVNYVFVFYRAMIIFARKHFERGQASTFGFFIHLAIYFRAFLALISRLFGNSWQLILDALIAYGSFLFITSWYAGFADKNFDLPFVSVLLIIYTGILSVVLLFSNVYDQNFRVFRLFRGWFFAMLMLLGAYALLPESIRFSRAVVLIGSGMSLLGGLAWRFALHALNQRSFPLNRSRFLKTLVIGTERSLDQVTTLLAQHDMKPSFIAGVHLASDTHYPKGFVGCIDHLTQAIEDFRINELIFDLREVPFGEMMQRMDELRDFRVSFKMALGSPLFIVGSQEALAPFDQIRMGWRKNLNLQSIRRLKRLFDILTSILFTLLSPILLLFIDQKLGFLRNIVLSLFGRQSWVGLDPRGKHVLLPKLKPGVAFELMNVILPESDQQQSLDQNIQYLSRYTPFSDGALLYRHLHALGKRAV